MVVKLIGHAVNSSYGRVVIGWPASVIRCLLVQPAVGRRRVSIRLHHIKELRLCPIDLPNRSQFFGYSVEAAVDYCP